jgi:hypothetical protein
MAVIDFGVRITADNKAFIDGVEASEKQLNDLASKLRDAARAGVEGGKGMEGMTASVLKGTVAVEFLNKAYEKLIGTYDAMREATLSLQTTQARLEATIVATGRAGTVSSQQINEFAEAYSKISRFDDTQLKQTATTLLTFGQLTEKQVERVVRAAGDLTTVMGGDLHSNALLLAKSMTETSDSIGPLERALGDLDKATKDNIITLRQQGETLKAGNALLDVVERHVRGTAVASYRGLERQIEGTKKAYDDLLKSVGSRLFSADSRDASVFETTLVALRKALENYTFSVRTYMAMMEGFRKGGPGGAMFALASLDPESNQGKPNFGSGRVVPASTKKPLTDDERAAAIELENSKGQLDLYLIQLDKRRAMEKEITNFKALATKAGMGELEQARIIGEIREKYTHEQEKAAEEAKRRQEQLAHAEGEAMDEKQRMGEELGKSLQDQGQVYLKIVQDQQDQVEQARLDLALVGATTAEASRLRREYELNKALKNDLAKMDAFQQQKAKEGLATALDTVTAIEAQAEAKKQLLDATKAQQDAEAKMLADWGDFAGKVLTDFFTATEHRIHALREDFRQLIQDILQVAGKRIILSVVGAVSGNAALSSQAATIGSNTLGGYATSALSSGASYAGSGIASGLGYTAGFGGVGEFSAGYTAQAAYLAGTAETASASGSVMGALGEIAAAVPVWGWILAAIVALVAIFSKPGGGPKQGGSFFGAYDANGQFVAAGNAPGTENGRYYTPTGMDSTAHKYTDQIATGFYDALSRLGGTVGSASFGFGMDMDPQGSAQARLSAQAVINGRTAYEVINSGMGNSPEEMTAEIADKVPRLILSALQAADWKGASAGVGQILSTVNANTASQDAIKGIIDLADAFGTLRRSLNDLDLGKFLADLAKSPKARLAEMGTALTALSGKTKISVEELQKLGQATGEYQSAVANLLVGFEQAKVEIAGMFGDTARNIRLTNLDDPGKYAFYQNESNRLLSNIQTSDSSDDIRNWASKINEDINAAYQLLSPEQQRAHEQEYLDRLDKVNKIVTDRLEAVQKQTASEANAILAQIRDALDLKAKEFKEAADTMNGAANTSAAAAARGTTLTVNIRGGNADVIVNDGG